MFWTPNSSSRSIQVIGLPVLLVFSVPRGGPGAQERLDPPALAPAEITPAVERAIERGLAYLRQAQRPDGSLGKSRREAYPTYPTAMSALAGLAFLSSGSTPTRGPYAPQIRRIADYLLRASVNADGLISDRTAGEERPMYSHAFAMTFLALTLGQEPDAAKRGRIRAVLRGAIELTARAQSDEGGWGYSPNYYQDEGTLTVTQLQGLRACRDAGIVVPKRLIDGAIRFIESSANSDGSVRYRVRSSQVRPGVTCAAVVTLWQAGRYDDPLLKRISDYMRRNIRLQWAAEYHAEYVQYYLSQARFVLGGQEWLDFYRQAADMFVSQQLADGSWEGSDGGDVYGTAIALLALQLPYNRLTIYRR